MTSLEERLINTQIDHSLEVLDFLSNPDSGIRAADSPGYNFFWPKDAIYVAGAEFSQRKSRKKSIKLANLITDIFVQNSSRLEDTIKHPEKAKNVLNCFPSKYKFPAAKNQRYQPVREWGHHQLNMIGLYMLMVSYFKSKGHNLIDSEDRRGLMKKLFEYILAVSCFDSGHGDNGQWEWRVQEHASSHGAVLAGLKKLKKDPFFDYLEISDPFLDWGNQRLYEILPRESPLIQGEDGIESDKKRYDSAQLELIWPCNILNKHIESLILENIEKHLVRKKGVMRYLNDAYVFETEHDNKTLGYDPKPRWPLLLGYLSIIYSKKGNQEKAGYYLNQMNACLIEKKGMFFLPESYYRKKSGLLIPNKNTPLAWAHAVHIPALHEYKKAFLRTAA